MNFGTESGMEKLPRIVYLLTQYLVVIMITLGYWIEMAEELEASNNLAKVAKGLLVLVKLLVFSR